MSKKKTTLVKIKDKTLPAVSKTWRFSRWVIGGGVFVIGLSGIPGDIELWQRWIDAIMYDPIVTELANKVVGFADFINQWWFRGLLVLSGLSIILWKTRPMWRLRHKLWFKWRKLVTEQVWISKESAIEILKNSDWGRLNEPNVVETISIFDMAAIGSRRRTVYGMSDTQKALLKYNIFINKALNNFASSNPKSFNQKKDEYDEVALRKFTRVAIDNDIESEFGSAPDYKVT
jgi:hypothetical protein